MENKVYANLFYFRNLNSIGGIETWYYNISRLYGEYDLTLVYRQADRKQLKRLSKYMRCIKWNGVDTFKCKRLFINFGDDLMEYVKYDEVYFFIHGDYEDMVNRGQLDKTTIEKWWNKVSSKVKPVGVSKAVCQAFYNLVGVMPELCYNPLYEQENKPFIRLCSAQRMTSEKGGDRIIKLIKALEKYCEENDSSYEFTIYTNQEFTLPKLTDPHRIVIKEPTFELNRIINNYDYFVALSDNEGYCYSVVEALIKGVPAVITPCPVFAEIGLNSRNSVKVEFDCSNLEKVVKSLYTKKFKFNYTPPKSSIEDYLYPEPTTYEEDNRDEYVNGVVLVKCIKPYKDLRLERIVRPDDLPFEVSEARANQLLKMGVVEVI